MTTLHCKILREIYRQCRTGDFEADLVIGEAGCWKNLLQLCDINSHVVVIKSN